VSATLTENLGALGELDLSLSFDKLLYDLLRQDNLVRLYRGEKLTWTMVVTKRGGDSASGISVTARDPRILLGEEGSGPTIEDREYIAGTTHLSNGSFTLLDPAIPTKPLFWTLREDTTWQAPPPVGGSLATTVGVFPDSDDVAESTEPAPARPGQTWETYAAVVHGSTTAGRYRQRLIYEGHFHPEPIGDAFSGWGPSTRTPTGDINLTTDPTGTLSGPVFRCQSGQPNLIDDGDFESGNLDQWNLTFGNWFNANADAAWDGTHYAMTDTSGGNPAFKLMEYKHPFAVVEGEQYQMRLVAKPSEAHTTTDGQAYMSMAVATGPPPYVFIETARADTNGQTTTNNAGFRILLGEITVGPGQVSMTPLVIVAGQSQGQWDLDTADLIRTKGNIDTRTEAAKVVTPERTYRWEPYYRVDDGVTAGRVQLRAVAYGEGRPDLILAGPELQSSKDALPQQATFDITPPSGYDFVARQIYCEDVFGGGIWIGEAPMVDADDTTRVYDAIVSTTGVAGLFHVAPDGTQTVRVACVLEADAAVWSTTSVYLRRVAEPIPTAAQVVDSLLHDPTNGHYLLDPGTITGDDTLAHDWTITDLTVRAALNHLSTSGLVQPLREDRVKADMTYHWGTAAQLYVERGALVLSDLSPIVRGNVAVDATSEGRIDRVKVIGATKADADGRPVTVTGAAANPVTTYDWQGRPVMRTRVVTETSIETVAHAEAYARALLDRASAVIVNVKATLVNHETIDDFDVGDWVFPENRDAGVEDPSRPVDVAGVTSFPDRMRVVHRQTRMGRGDFRAEVLDPDTGDWVPLADIDWEGPTTVEVELGTPLADITVPMG
jgi:hypothetical protein